MENLELFEAYNDGREVVLSSRQNRAITFTVLGGRIKDLINDSVLCFRIQLDSSTRDLLRPGAVITDLRWMANHAVLKRRCLE